MSKGTRLVLNGLEFAGWTEVAVTRSIEHAATAFSLRLTSRFPGQDNPAQIRAGGACKLTDDGDALVTGYVDTVGIDYSATDHQITVTGRSKTADAIDCSAQGKPGRWAASKAEAIAADLCAPYGIEVVTVGDTGAPIPVHRIEHGETVYDSIERLAAARSLLITDDGAGRLVLTRAGTGRATTALELGKNILAGNVKVDASKVFATYLLRGQRAGDDQDWGAAVSEVLGTATDSWVDRPRLLILHAEKSVGAKEARDRARWEASTRAAKSIAIEYTVAGWRQADGTLWTPNTLVNVSDDWGAVWGEFLIVTCVYELKSDGGRTTKLTLAPAAGFRPAPVHKASGHRQGVGLITELIPGTVVRGTGPTDAHKRARTPIKPSGQEMTLIEDED